MRCPKCGLGMSPESCTESYADETDWKCECGVFACGYDNLYWETLQSMPKLLPQGEPAPAPVELPSAYQGRETTDNAKPASETGELLFRRINGDEIYSAPETAKCARPRSGSEGGSR